MPAGSRVDVTHLIDHARFAGVPARLTILAFLILIADGYDIQSIAFAAPALAESWGVRRELLGPVLAASLIGMGLGSVALGWLGDRIGRKRAFCLCIAVLALGSLASAGAGSLAALVLFRFVTGLGLGGAAPLATSLSAEWTSVRWRSLAVAIALVGIPLGGMLGAAIAARIIPAYGWRSVFLVGAVSPLIFLALALPWMPESAKFLAGRPAERVRLARSLNRLVGERRFEGTEVFSVAEPQERGHGSIMSLLRVPYLPTTLLLWIAFSCNTLALYGFVNWMPTVLSGAGLPLQAALSGSVWFNCGGMMGALGGSLLISRYGSRSVGACVACAGALSAALLGIATSAHAARFGTSLFGLVVVAGASLNGMQAFLYAVSAHSYPTRIRGTGVGAASAVARVGGVLSSGVGSAFFALGLAVAEFFYILAAVILATTASFYLLRSHIPGRAASALLARGAEV
ncbi:MAG TPA: MFS transporter [Steroidobacteraceae bacterium]|nr:MFS transporter [Steroidobacteraceae bacterium]